MGRLNREERGVSAIIGFVFVVALVMMGFAVYMKEQMPQDWKQAEFNTMQDTKNVFFDLRGKIVNLRRGDVAAVPITLGTRAPTAFVSSTTNSHLQVTTASSVSDVDEAEDNQNLFEWWRGYGTYVKEASPDWNYSYGDYENEHHQVSTTDNERIWTFMKFDLGESGLYDRNNYVFYDDARMYGARLYMYVLDVDLEDEPDNVLEVGMPQKVSLWVVENDNWMEGLTWSQAQNIHDQNRDNQMETVEITGEGEWVSWDVTNYVNNVFKEQKDWGKWYQTKWWDLDATLESGRFASGYEKYNSNTGATTGYELSGNGWVTSMAFDARDNSSFWNYISYEYSGSPSIQVRFGNTLTELQSQGWTTVTGTGFNPNAYGRYAQYRIDPNGGTVYNITLEYTVHLSFLLREPVVDGENKVVAFKTRAVFNSSENSVASSSDFDPRLRIVYQRNERLGYTRTSSLPYGYSTLINFGHIKYKAYNESFRDTNYLFEGGLVAVESGSGWYQAILAYPPNFVEVVEADGNNVYVTVTRYQIRESKTDGEAVGGAGGTMLKASYFQEEWKVRSTAAPNASAVTITIVSEHPRIWREYLQRLAAETNYILSDYEPGSYYTYGDHVNFDYDSVSLTINGKNLSAGSPDIYYTEKIIWLDVTAGLYQGGRT